MLSIPDVNGGLRPVREPYYTWQTFEAALAGESIRWAGKPGLEAWEALRPSACLLAEELAGEPGQRVLDLRCGAGVCGALAARRGAEVTLCDDSLVAVQATRRTLDLNGVSGEVIHGQLEGFRPSPEFDVVFLDAPRGREWVQHLLTIAARALRPGGKLYLAGPNRGGIQGYIKDANDIVGPCRVKRIKASNRLAICERSCAVSGQRPVVNRTCETTARGEAIRFVTPPGVFSQGELDAGTRALIETMVIQPGESALDLGCGCGVVGAVAARMGGQVVCVDQSAAALQATRATLDWNGASEAEVLASDCASAVLGRRLDVAATNPPFHQGPGVEYDVAHQFVRDASHVLKPGGRLYLVANRFIRYERVMDGLFARVRTAYEDNRFRVLEAVR
jgi:16S rRNA (guanine1207-N2)-methyltransferase